MHINLPLFKELIVLFKSFCFSATSKYFETFNALCSLAKIQLLNSDSIKYNSRKKSPINKIKIIKY